MRRFDFTDEPRRAIARDRFQHVDPRVQRRNEILWLKSPGETHERIAQRADVSRRTVQRLLDLFAAGGLEAVRQFHEPGRASRRPTQVRQFLRTTRGLKWRKVAAIPVPLQQSVAEQAATQAAFLKDGAGTATG